MKREPCLEPEAIAEVLASPAEDPRRAHLRTCARCAALAASYRAFLAADAGGVPAGDLADAEHRLGAVLGALAPAPMPAPAPPPAPAARRPRYAPALALAAGVVALAAAVWLAIPRGDDTRLRGEGDATPHVHDATLDGRGLAARWSPHPGADGYRVRLYRASLEEVAAFGPLSDTTLTVAPAGLPADLAASAGALVRVEALADGDVIARSAPVPLRTE